MSETSVVKKPKKALFHSLGSNVDYSRYGYLFVAPFVIIWLIFGLYPIIFTFRISFTNLTYWKLDEMVYVGFENFRNLLVGNSPQRKLFWDAFGNTVIMWLCNFAPQIFMALILGWWFTDQRLRIRGQGAFKVLIFLPNTITAATIATLFYSMFGYPIAPVNTLLQQVGIINTPIEFFRSVGFSRGLISFLQWWMWYGNTMIILTAGILGINPTLFEAAMVDGCTGGKMFRYITLPLLKPILLYNLVTSLIGGLQMFDIPHLMTKGNPNNTTNTVARFIYTQSFQGSNNFNVGAAASIILFIIIVIISIGLFYVMSDHEPKAKKEM